MWKAKFNAFLIHFFITALVALVAAVLVFKLWFPAPFSEMMGGTELFMLVVGCDLILGPLLSFIIYNPSKNVKILLADYAVVIVLQLGALVYGILVVAEARPAFLVFTVDRYVMVSAGELPPDELQKAIIPKWQSAPLIGYHTVYVEPVTNPDEKYSLIMSALGGGQDLQHLVKNYRAVPAYADQILSYARSLEELRKQPEIAKKLDETLAGIDRTEDELLWLPVEARKIFWVVLVDRKTAMPVAWINQDPFSN